MTNEQKRATMKQQNRNLGLLCMLLVPLTLLFGLIGSKYNVDGWYRSISANFYTNAKPFMIVGIGAMAILFYSYEGYDKIDKIITNIACGAGIGILAFPCDWEGADVTQILFPFIGLGVSHVLHCISAITLFVTFGAMVGWRFTRHKGIMTIRKMRRNVVYYSCAVVIAIFLIMQVITSVAGIGWFTIVNEFFMLEAFGFAWLVKGEAIPFFNDKKVEVVDLT